MADIVYPIGCTNEQSFNLIENVIFEFLTSGVKVHFLHRNYQYVCPDPGLQLISEGIHPSIKVTFIEKELEMEVNGLVEAHFLQFPPNKGG